MTCPTCGTACSTVEGDPMPVLLAGFHQATACRDSLRRQLTESREALVHLAADTGRLCDVAERAATHAADARVAELEAALRPFAAQADGLATGAPGVNMDDYERAAAVLAKKG